MTAEKIDAILNSVSQRVAKLVPAGRFYVVLHEPKINELTFHVDSNTQWGSRPCSTGKLLPDLVISGRRSLLFEREFPSRLKEGGIHYWPDGDLPHAWLGVPVKFGDDVLGALIVESWRKTQSFSTDDEKTLTAIARQAAIAIANARLYAQLRRKVDVLQILNQTGQQLTRGLVKQEGEILGMIYKSAMRIGIDTTNMYIAIYEPKPDHPDDENQIHGTLRFPLSFEDGRKSSMPTRVARKGMTEHVIRTRASHNPTDVQKSYQEDAPDSHGRETPSRTRSWLGIPMLSEGQVFGVIVLRNFDFEQYYTEDDQEMLEILASQVAVALQNLKLFEKVQNDNEQRLAAERVSVMSITAAEFVHKMNNLGGTIPVRVGIAKTHLDGSNARDVKIIAQLDGIKNDTELMLQAAQEIQKSANESAPEPVNVNELLQIASKRALNLLPNMDALHFQFGFLEPAIPEIIIARNTLLDTFTNIIKNGLDAITEVEGGVVTVETHLRQDVIEVLVRDNGKGIPESELTEIFKLFYTTKGTKGLGFGLWRDKTFIKRSGGDIQVISREGKGSEFTIRIPVRAGL